MTIPFRVRSALERVLRLTGLHEVQIRQAAFAGAGGFDLTRWPKSKRKSYGRPRPERPEQIAVHVTDVLGGFGVSRPARARWESVIASGELREHEYLPDVIPTAPGDYASLRGIDLSGDPLAAMANRLALWERLKDQAYHQVAAQNGDVLATRTVMDWSWHAGKVANRIACGFAVDCAHDGELDEWIIETGRAGLRALKYRIAAVWTAGLPAPIVVLPHRAFSASRLVDPQGNTEAGVWSEIVRPVVDRDPELVIDYEYKSRSGRPIPRVWDERALYDWRGRRL